MIYPSKIKKENEKCKQNIYFKFTLAVEMCFTVQYTLRIKEGMCTVCLLLALVLVHLPLSQPGNFSVHLNLFHPKS